MSSCSCVRRVRSRTALTAFPMSTFTRATARAGPQPGKGGGG